MPRLKGKKVSWGSIGYSLLMSSVLTVWILDLNMKFRIPLGWDLLLPVLWLVSASWAIWFFRENQ